MAISKILYKSSESATPETWMDVTGNTSESSNMLSGTVGTKADGTSATGNIASKTSSDLTASGLTVTAPAGHYASDATKTLTDANLIAENVKKDVEIFGVTGSYEGSGGTLITKAVSANGTYNASDDNADGYSSVVVNVPQPSVTYTETPGPNGSTIVNINTTGISNGADVNFIDYDGTLVASRTKAEIDAMTSDSDLPANPTHTGLTAQGWNWTVAQLKAQLTAMPDQPIWVGQMYITESGATDIDVVMPEGRLSPIMTIAVNGEVSIDWGDETTPDTVTGTSLTSRKAVPHTYISAGSYTIKISSVSGTYSFYCSNTYTLLRKNTTENQNCIYANCIQHIRLGSGITSIGTSAFYNCYSLASVTIPSSVTSIGNSVFYSCYSLASVAIPSGVTSIGVCAFQNCYSLANVTFPSGVTSIETNAFYGCHSLASVTIPSGVTSIGTSAFDSCSSLASVTIPSGVTSIGSSAFYYCNSLASVTIPSGVTSIGGNAFYGCYSLANVTIPSGVTSIGSGAFQGCYSLASVTIPSSVTSIGSYVFYGCNSLASITIPSGVTSIGGSVFSSCYSLASVTIPSGVTSIGSYAFSGCYGMAEYHFQSTTPPTLSDANAFSYIVSDCIMYVPYSADHSILTAYQTASNWSTYASYIQEEVQ